MRYRIILAGTGGWGEYWCREFLPAAIKRGLVEVVAVADPDHNALTNAIKYLGLLESCCFADAADAFRKVAADFCVIAAPPQVHERIIALALENKLDILCEKPMSDSYESALRIVEMVRNSGRKMAVTMSHRFRRDIWTLRDIIADSAYGPADYLSARLSWDARHGLNPRQANMPYTMLMEGAVHHLDIIETIAGAECTQIYADAWTPSWGNFLDGAQALVTMRFVNGMRASYESAWCNAVGLNPWGREYFRVECRDATIVLQNGAIECHSHIHGKQFTESKEGAGTLLPLRQGELFGNHYLLDQFCKWISGGAPMPTRAERNIRSMALVFASIESSRRKEPVDITDFVELSSGNSRQAV